MKLIITVVSNKDTQPLLEQLVKRGFRATKLASTGGFLKEGNTTLLIGVPEGKVEEVIEIISSICRQRQEVVTPITPISGQAETFFTFPLEVAAGGAAVFVLDVEKYYKV